MLLRRLKMGLSAVLLGFALAACRGAVPPPLPTLLVRPTTLPHPALLPTPTPTLALVATPLAPTVALTPRRDLAEALVTLPFEPTALALAASPTLEPSPFTPTPVSEFTLTTWPYVFPVQPAANTRFRRYHHDYPATDIFAPAGSAFVAVTSGVVDFVSWVDLWDPAVDDPATRGGLSVALLGDDGVRYYGSHLAAIAPGLESGTRVVAGQYLGLVGDSGNARPGAAHLHFGISPPTTPEDWAVRRGTLAPYPYLMAWLAGEMRTPQWP